MVPAAARRRLLLALVLGAACLARARPDTEPGDCDPSQSKKCEDLARCSPPTERLVVPEAAVLVLGNTGCGKSTLARHLSGDDADMQSVVESNEFLITGKMIGSGVMSVTKIPELMTDNRTGTNYFDCPGFEDNRGSCVEVATTFYMKDILRHARRLKVLLLTPYFGVRRGQDHSEFVGMLLHAARSLRRVDKLRDSVALIVTKVEAFAKRGREWVPLPEDDVKQGVAAFLREDVLTFLKLQAGEALPDEADDFQRAIELVDVFLEQNKQGKLIHIGIFRTPDEEGRLKDIAMMEQGRQLLLDLVHNDIRYAEVQPDDFGFSVSDRTKLFALQQARNLSEAVVAELDDLGDALGAVRAEISYDADDITATAQHFLKDANEIRAVAAGVGNSSSVQVFCDRLATDVPRVALGDAATLSLAARVAAECRQLDVLQTVSDAPLVAAAALASQWSRPLHAAADGLAKRGDWNRFLTALYGRLSMHDQQLKRAQGDLSFAPMSAGNLSAFEPRAAALGLHAALQPAAARPADLNALLARVTIAPQYECLPDGGLVVRGESLLLSEVVDKANNGVCGDDTTIRWLQVFALNTFFVDRTVRLAGVSLVVVAPRWEVVGEQAVDLSGVPGAGAGRKPKEAATGLRGADGAAGQPGGPGGHFLAVGLDFAGGKLRGSVSGGRGGNGQDGGDGGPGQRGGGHGADGGDGGVGGIGGRRGSATFVFLGQRPDWVFERDEGSRGKIGRGGSGGDHRAFSGRYRRKRSVGIVLGGLVIASAIGGAVYMANKIDKASRPPPPPPPPPPPVFNDGKRGKDGESRGGLKLPNDPPARRWAQVPARTAAYIELNLRHPYGGKQLRHFKSLLGRKSDFTELAGVTD